MLRKVLLRNIVNKNDKIIIGLNSGTSADGIDAVIVRVIGNGFNSRVKLITGRTYKFKQAFKAKIKKYAEPDFNNAEKWLELDIELAGLFSSAAKKIIKQAGIKPDDIDLIGSHGQTIRHKPNTRFGTITCQLGDPAGIAVQTGITTVGDFRVADTAAGGEGAPLTPVANAILFGKKNKRIGVLNIGGVANITHISSNKGTFELFGCDTGPGNMLIDHLAMKLFRCDYDMNGRLASKGKTDYSIIQRFLSRKYFAVKGPKSTGRETFGKTFGETFYKHCRMKKLSSYDIITTASMLTVEAVRKCITINKLSFDEIILAGGGVRNNFIKKMLSVVFQSSEITTSADYGYPQDYLEAVSFAVLANEAVCSNRYLLKNVTGAQTAVVLGKICQS